MIKGVYHHSPSETPFFSLKIGSVWVFYTQETEAGRVAYTVQEGFAGLPFMLTFWSLWLTQVWRRQESKDGKSNTT